jgi:hypothetical protein
MSHQTSDILSSVLGTGFVGVASLLCTHLLPLQAQDNEELVCLQVDADTGNLRLLDMLLDLELFLCFATNRWTACVTH